MVQGSLENVTAAPQGFIIWLSLHFFESSHKQVLLAHMESKQPGWMEEHCPDIPWVPVCPSCPQLPRQCLVGVTPLTSLCGTRK